MTLKINLDQESDTKKTRVVESPADTFKVNLAGPHNLWEIRFDGKTGAVPKILSGYYTSPQEAYKAISIYTALKDKKNGDSTAQKSDSN